MARGTGLAGPGRQSAAWAEVFLAVVLSEAGDQMTLSTPSSPGCLSCRRALSQSGLGSLARLAIGLNIWGR